MRLRIYKIVALLLLSTYTFIACSIAVFQLQYSVIMPHFTKPRTLAVPVKTPQGHFFFAGHTIERVKWWSSGPMRKLYFLLVVMIMTNTANGFDRSMMNGLQSLSYWQEYFNHPSGSILGLFNASMSLSSLIGLFFVAYTIDLLGRRAGVLIGSVIMCLGVGLQTGAANFGMFVASRLLIGFGDCIVLGSASLLITELAPPQDRAVLVTLSGASYHSGAFIASWVTFATLKIPSDWSWRLPSLLQCTFSIIISIAIFFTPESLVGSSVRTDLKKHWTSLSSITRSMAIEMTSLCSLSTMRSLQPSRWTKKPSALAGSTSSRPLATEKEWELSLLSASSPSGKYQRTPLLGSNDL